MDRKQLTDLDDIPNIGPAMVRDLTKIGIAKPADLRGKDPYALYERLCRVTATRHDPCVLDTFISAVRFMEGAPARPWWAYTSERKAKLAEAANGDGRARAARPAKRRRGG